MVNKQGVLKTLEAVIAILLIFGFLYALLSQRQQLTGETPLDLSSTRSFLFDQLTFDNSYRTCLTNPALTPGACATLAASYPASYPCVQQVMDFIQKHTPTGYDFSCELCKTSASCSTQNIPLETSVYTDSVFISGKESRVFRIYFWPTS